MNHEPTSTARVRRLRERRARGVLMVVHIEVGKAGIELLVGNGLLKEHEMRDRQAAGEACLAALEQWAGGRGAAGPRDRVKALGRGSVGTNGRTTP